MTDLYIEFTDNTLRVLRIDNSKNITFRNEVNLGFSLSDENVQRKDKTDMIRDFEDVIAGLLENVEDFKEREYLSAGILIGTEQTFLNVTPVDFDEDNSSVSAHIIWELSNYYPDTYKNYNVRYYRLNNNRVSETIDDTFLIAINKKKLEFIKILCDNANLKIDNIEIDHIVVDKCLKEKYPEDIINKSILLVGIKKGRVDFSFLSDGKIKYYDYGNLEGSDLKLLVINQINLLSSLLFNTDKIFIYGDDINNDLKNFLKEQFENIDVSDIIYDETSDDTTFAPLYGMALKNL